MPPMVPPLEFGFRNTLRRNQTQFDARIQKPLIFQRLILICWIVLDVFESSLGHDWIRTNDLFRVKEAL
jgi:hypothetical protein